MYKKPAARRRSDGWTLRSADYGQLVDRTKPFHGSEIDGGGGARGVGWSAYCFCPVFYSVRHSV